MSFDGSKAHKRMMIVYLMLALGVGSGMIFKLIRTQVTQGDLWRKMAMERENDIQNDPARRGTIYSSDGKILATNTYVCDLYLDLTKTMKRDAKNNVVYDPKRHTPIIENSISDDNFEAGIEQVCTWLAECSKEHDYAYYYDRITSERSKAKPRGCFAVAKKIPHSTWEAICKLKGWNRAVVKYKDGETVIRQERAHELPDGMAENVIGFKNAAHRKDQPPYTGLEGFYDSILRGQDGRFLCRRLTRSVWIQESQPGHLLQETGDSVTINSNQTRARIDGSDIIATIDTRFQDVAQKSLSQRLALDGAESGCAILMEVETGYILACCNLALDSTGRYREVMDRNIACSDLYEPGSTFKTVVMTAMLSDTMKIDTSMRVRTGYKKFPTAYGEIKDDHPIDTLSLPGVLRISSNVGMCELGWKYYNHNHNALKERVMSIFPFEALSLDLRTSERSGRVIDLKPGRSFLNFCYGYSCNVSAMQLITFYNALAGNGRMVKPLFCKGIVKDGEMRTIAPIVLKDQICSAEVAKQMREMLIGVVQKGTGDNIKDTPYGIAGKTGTAVYNYKDASRFSASFAGFFPAENPKYTCLVLMRNVRVHGRQAAYVVKDIADCVTSQDKELGYVMLKQDTNLAKKATNRAPVAMKARRSSIKESYLKIGVKSPSRLPNSEWLVWSTTQDSTGVHEKYEAYEVPEGVVPNLKGMTIREAMKLLEAAGLKCKFSGYGRVAEQYPKAHTRAQEGSTVTLRLEN